MWNYQNNHKIGCDKMKNKQYDTVETDPKSHRKIVERVTIDTPKYMTVHFQAWSRLFNKMWLN
jgi:hypothetical protein